MLQVGDSIDTVAAGDVFTGAFAVSFCKGKGFTHAVEYANYAAALSTTRKGAQTSVPCVKEVEYLIEKVKPHYI